LEGMFPADRNRRGRIRHAAGNLAISLINLVIITGGFGLLLANVSSWAEAKELGLFRALSLTGPVATIAGLVILDGWMYIWHRANHEIPFLWRFHRVHHSDPEMDVTTATRFHPGEIAISAVLRLALIPILGITISDILLYDALLFPVIQFHHSNVRFPSGMDKWLRTMIASPAMHRVHHSPVRIETDSNYGSILSLWDRIFGTFRLRKEPDPQYVFGLDGERDDQNVVALILNPLKK